MEPRICVMGVAGVGKTTIGRALATELSLPFVDADDFHDADAKLAIARGVALDDEQRAPWLSRVNARLRELADGGSGFVLACSALTEDARRRLRTGISGLRFVLLSAPAAIVEDRLRRRRGHFAGPDLLPSQLQTLEVPKDAVVVDATGEPTTTVAAVCRSLGQAITPS